MDYVRQYEYASRDHVILLLLWHTGARTGDIRALEFQNCKLDGSQPALDYVDRPKEDTPLKNDGNSERFNGISTDVAMIIQDYIDGPESRTPTSTAARR